MPWRCMVPVFMQILAAFDKFKDAMSASRACEAVRLGAVQALGESVQLQAAPLTDGGEGFCDLGVGGGVPGAHRQVRLVGDGDYFELCFMAALYHFLFEILKLKVVLLFPRKNLYQFLFQIIFLLHNNREHHLQFEMLNLNFFHMTLMLFFLYHYL